MLPYLKQIVSGLRPHHFGRIAPRVAACSLRSHLTRVRSIKRTQRSLMSALLEARKTFGGKTVALWDADDRKLTYDEIVRAAFALGSACANTPRRKETVGIMLPTGVGAVIYVLRHSRLRPRAGDAQLHRRRAQSEGGVRGGRDQGHRDGAPLRRDRQARGADRRAVDGRQDRLPRRRAREAVASSTRSRRSSARSSRIGR